jgi:AcrR family transcriptional regulator
MGLNVDGRTARRDRNRDIVLDAALELFVEGQLEPNVMLVAERAGLSERSVFRYFEDTDALVRAAIARNVERTAPLFEMPGVGEGSFEERVERFIASRLRLYEAVAATARAAVLRARTNALIATQLAQVRQRLGTQLEAMFAPELATMPPARRRSAVAAADTLFQFEGVEHLRVRLELTPARTKETLRDALTALFT